MRRLLCFFGFHSWYYLTTDYRCCHECRHRERRVWMYDIREWRRAN